MNHKGVLFSIDLIIAIAITVFVIGSMYALYHYNVVSAVELKQQKGLESSMNIVLNNLALGPRSCDLVSASGTQIKKIAFCWNSLTSFNTRDFNINDYNVLISCPLATNKNCLNLTNPSLPTETDFIAKDVNMWVTSGTINKDKYLECITGQTCAYNQLVRVYVWQ